MELSMISAVVLAQSLPLWAVPSVLIQNYNLKRFPDGTASLAKPASGCAPVRSSSRAPPPPTRRELSPPIPRQPASRPATGSDAAGLGPGFRLARLLPAVIPANPTMSATPTTARATVSDFAIRSHLHVVRTGCQSRALARPGSSAGTALQ